MQIRRSTTNVTNPCTKVSRRKTSSSVVAALASVASLAAHAASDHSHVVNQRLTEYSLPSNWWSGSQPNTKPA